MRKRAQRKAKPVASVPTAMPRKTKLVPTLTRKKSNWWIALSLVGIFMLVLLLNSYFNVTSQDTYNPEGEGFQKYYLSGPDPYYNMRLIDQTLYGTNPGHYPYYGQKDPMLNYPDGSTGTRAPLLNMMAISFARLFTPFMDEVDALGLSMQFVPALFGALLIFPVYAIGATLFGRKQGLLAALFIAIIPIHLGSGHGSAFTLFDHDSFNLLLYFMTFFFFIKSIKDNDRIRSMLYAVLGGIPLAALSMTWVEARYLYAIIAVYAIVQMIVDIFTSKTNAKSVVSPLLLLFTGYFVSLPVIASKPEGLTVTLELFLCLAVLIFGALYFVFSRRKLPWTLSLPVVFLSAIVVLILLFFINDIASVIPAFGSLRKIAEILYGTGIYGSKVSMTIAEANTYELSRTIMSFGPALYWLAWAGFLFIAYAFYKQVQQRVYLFILVIFIIQVWLTGVAGRFLNDLVPWIALLGGWMLWFIIDKINYGQMVKSIRSAGGGLHGLRRGIKFLHVVGIIFIGFLVIFPNAYLAFDAAVPVTEKDEFFGNLPNGAYGASFVKEAYWVDAYSWLTDQDTDIENPTQRPAYISWWDYGFYEVALGGHPTVADNFQDGIPCAANFQTSTSETEAVAVWIVRLLDAEQSQKGAFSEGSLHSLDRFLGTNDTGNITSWITTKTSSPSYNAPIAAKYDPELSQLYRVGQQWPENAVYHDVVNVLTEKLTDEQITQLYRDLQETTGFTIRYYGVEGYDKQIFDIFGFLADKSLLLVAQNGNSNPEDEFVQIVYVTQNNKEYTYEELQTLSDAQLRADPPVNTKKVYKDAYFETMFYRTYIGLTDNQSGVKTEPNYQIPCWGMKHFHAEYISPISKFAYYTGKSAVVIAKYYAGAFVNGTISFLGEPMQAQVVVQKNISHYAQFIPVDHDTNDTGAGGNFSVIVPAGEVVLQLRRYPELGANAFVMKNVSFTSNTSADLAPITDQEAMRQGGNYNRFLNISIEPATLKGYVYLDTDNDDMYNVSTDKPIEGASIFLREVTKVDSDNPENIEHGITRSQDTNTNGLFNEEDLPPGLYELYVQLDDLYIYASSLKLYSGNTTYNVSKPQPAALTGVVYYDSNFNGQYDSGEEIADAAVELLLGTTELQSTVTASDGTYSFTDLIPGTIDELQLNEYTVKASKLPDYQSEVTVYPEENTTTSLNISLSLAPVTVSGSTTVNDQPVAGVVIAFDPDGSVVNNTAEAGTATSDNTGMYEVELTPGSYNVTVDMKDGSTPTYSFNGTLILSVGQTEATYNLAVTKESTTVTGQTLFAGEPVGNITVNFVKDTTVANNTAIPLEVISDKTGLFTTELAPGSYTILIDDTRQEDGTNVTYSYSALLTIEQGELAKAYNLNMAKEQG
jgi:asparagine N-glycosylation enzyme membrane subunit Stt3